MGNHTLRALPVALKQAYSYFAAASALCASSILSPKNVIFSALRASWAISTHNGVFGPSEVYYYA